MHQSLITNYEATVAWNVAPQEHYFICYTEDSSQDVNYVAEIVDQNIGVLFELYNIDELRYTASHAEALQIGVLLFPSPTGKASTGRATFTCCHRLTGTAGYVGHVSYLTPSHTDWTQRSHHGGLQNPAEEYHPMILMAEFTNVVQRSVRGDPQPPSWLLEGISIYNGLFHTTEWNGSEGYRNLIRHVYDRKRSEIFYGHTLESSRPTISTTDVYFGGALIAKYLASRFGEDILLRLTKNEHSGFEETLAAEMDTAGTTVQAEFEGMRDWLGQMLCRFPRLRC